MTRFEAEQLRDLKNLLDEINATRAMRWIIKLIWEDGGYRTALGILKGWGATVEL